MRYWDASALVPLVVAEPTSSLVREWLAEDEQIITWVWTRTEIVSAIERRTREGSLLSMQRREVLGRFDTFASNWDEVTDVLAVRSRANAPVGTPSSARRRCGSAWCGAVGAGAIGRASHVCLPRSAGVIGGRAGEPSRTSIICF